MTSSIKPTANSPQMPEMPEWLKSIKNETPPQYLVVSWPKKTHDAQLANKIQTAAESSALTPILDSFQKTLNATPTSQENAQVYKLLETGNLKKLRQALERLNLPDGLKISFPQMPANCDWYTARDVANAAKPTQIRQQPKTNSLLYYKGLWCVKTPDGWHKFKSEIPSKPQ
ncbi:MAG: hypothetical protein VKJ06_05700 [Vampirovibrionales bacterium]|nr:hypothetical protein [Vampirovibrionales bacterium]